MSEVQSRPAASRGRGSARGGRGGFSSRGGRGGRSHTTNGDKPETTAASIEDEGEVGQLKKQYGSRVATIKEMFPDWTDEDVVFALQETNGDLETTVDRITDGSITQWGEVSKAKKDKSRSKAKEATATTSGDSAKEGRVSRGGRAGAESGRGRSRGAERGRGGRGRGAATAAHTNGSRKETVEPSVPTVESNAWGPAPTEEEQPATDGWGPAATEAPATKVASSIIPDGAKKSWASIFTTPAPAPKKAAAPAEKPVEAPKGNEPVELSASQPEASIPEAAPVDTVEAVAIDTSTLAEPELSIPPTQDELTVDNLEQLPDISHPVLTATAASTTASSWDNRTATGGAAPYSALQGQPQAVRPQQPSGFQASALKAAGPTGRTASYQRRVLDQEEAVRMPGNREVDRAAVQFGAFNLNGSGEEDVDGDREEPETRAQPPQHSPVAHPRAALPPAPQQATTASETVPTPKQTAGVPAAAHPTNAPGLPSPQSLASAQSAQQVAPANAQFGQYSRYGPGGDSTLPPKPYDGFNQQAPSTQGPFEGYQQPQSQPQTQTGAFSSAPNDFSSYYTADPQQRNAYSYYQQQYGQQVAQGQQEGSAPQQRSYSGYGGPQAEGASQFPQSAAQQSQSRYTTAGEGQTSGHTTPNPAAQAQQPGTAQAAQSQPGHPQQPQAGGNYPYGHPYYSSPYYAQYLNQYQQYGAGNYPGAPYPGKGGLHAGGYPQYGMTPGAPYEHASSPAAGGFAGSSLHGRDSALVGGLGDYGRAGTAPSSQAPQGLGSGAFGASQDTFGPGSTYQRQGYAQQGAQPTAGDDLKPFGDSKAANGRSPSLSQPGRPGSATNTAPGSALPPPQSQQAGYPGYPSHLQGHGLHGAQAGSQYGGLGGAGAAGQGHQSSQYGGYQGFGGNFYGNSQQQQQQQRGGWGGNYGH